MCVCVVAAVLAFALTVELKLCEVLRREEGAEKTAAFLCLLCLDVYTLETLPAVVDRGL